jgi:hypothetical protein
MASAVLTGRQAGKQWRLPVTIPVGALSPSVTNFRLLYWYLEPRVQSPEPRGENNQDEAEEQNRKVQDP